MNETAAIAAVTALYESIIGCWNARDAAGMAARFAPGAQVVGFDGSEMNGPGEIAGAIAAVFANHQTAPYVHIVRSVRLLTPEVAVLRAIVGMIPPGQTELNPAANAIQTLVASRTTGQWLGEVFQNTPAALHGRPDAVAGMTDELRARARSRP